MDDGPRFGPGPGGPRAIVFPLSEALDANHDGKLSAEEIDQAPTTLKALDKNRDGRLNAEEIGWPPRGPQGFGPPGGGPRGETNRPRPTLAQRVMSRDANGDGRVTADELPQSMHFLFRLANPKGEMSIDAQQAEQLSRRLSMPAPPMIAFPMETRLKSPESVRSSAARRSLAVPSPLGLDSPADGKARQP
jgi:hypothetical protein